ncbi:uncharacterized protein LOC111637087 [Centruroides sculpturatus]|uniref:uncharacterized protein LOC111637087 n=1 Tax=Centruroides sculpturatus TaxID=218467 RepID=UPI000C6EAFB4|nr:uncharacterized protein LOC111637087 [Centruroides sculpturatus]
MEKSSSLCFLCLLRPILSSIYVIGLDFISLCHCLPNGKASSCKAKLYKVYKIFLESFLWLMVVHFFIQLKDKDQMCVRWINLYGNDANSVTIVYVTLAGYLASQYSILRRKKFAFRQHRVVYSEEENVCKLIDLASLGIISLIFILLMATSMSTIFTFEGLKNQGSADTEALVCTTILSVWFLLLVAQAFSVLFISAVILFTITSSFFRLSKELIYLKKKSTICKDNINRFMMENFGLWEVIKDANATWEHTYPLINSHYLYLTCFFVYGALYVQMHEYIRIAVVIFSIFIVAAILIVSFLLSRVSSTIYDNFISIGVFSSSNLPVLNKMKILNFMNRYTGIIKGISIGGYITIKKTFVIRMVNGLYSVLSSLVELRTSKVKKSNCAERSYSCNTTSNYTNF